ncbi:CpG cytosine-specific DNA modification methyltransferase [Metamycoplasma cloacale]|uniref:DNA (Cytosine-5-)-methyltransferase n=1 Tax=Metamycoplasma cloacale TaxID=92401 RepID=A0A2Z4LLN6_9BACT|nr:DNA (cytosine-5-)-methyltransferase [Metamycoplasma cloacale]AWX42584.1 DNA (cytosine-5-)-methyltransferase [Metamycoplasma cloacale]VEU79696.1 CpG cytosine-specific DNA modification methyltransferase [Metamycoplasma cloacale]
MKKIKLFEFFSGIGSQYKAFKNIAKKHNIHVESVGCCEWYIDAIIGYMAIHYGLLKPEEHFSHNEMVELLKPYGFSKDSKQPISNNYFKRCKNLASIFPYLYAFVNKDYFQKKYPNNIAPDNSVDIRFVKQLDYEIDVMTYSFPCQDLSQQGKQRGLGKQTRSGLLFEVERILKHSKIKPKVLILENVKTLTSQKFIKQFNEWIDTLDMLGYHTSFKVLNSADFGSAQNRERIFAVSIRKDIFNNAFNFDNLISLNHKKLKNIIKSTNYGIDASNLLSEFSRTKFYITKSNINKSRLINYSKFNSETYIYLNTNLGPTLTASGANSRLKFYFPKLNKLRYINSEEAFLYLGFTNKDFNSINKTKLISDTKMIFLAGNSISIEVLESLFSEVIKWI